MKISIRRLLTMGTCLLVCAVGAGLQSAHADGYAFMPPAGWKTVAKPGHGIGMWVHNDSESFHQNISVIAERARGSLDQYTANGIQSIKAILPDVQFGPVQRTTVCGGHPATYLTYAATLRGRRLIYEQTATIWSTTAYVATYARLNTQPSLSAARNSLTSLCGGLPSAGAPALRYSAPAPRPSSTPTPAAQYATPAPVGSVAPTVTPDPGT